MGADYHPRRGRGRRGRGGGNGGDGGGGSNRDSVVTKENWKSLQDKANREHSRLAPQRGQSDEMKDEEAFRSGGARRSIQAHHLALSLAENHQGPPAPSSKVFMHVCVLGARRRDCADAAARIRLGPNHYPGRAATGRFSSQLPRAHWVGPELCG